MVWFDLWGPEDRWDHYPDGDSRRYVGSVLLKDEVIIDADPAFTHTIGWQQVAFRVYCVAKNIEIWEYEDSEGPHFNSEMN